MMTSITNKYTSLYKSLTLYFWKGDVCYVWEMSWRQGQTAILTQVLLLTITAFLSHLGLGCSTVGHWGPKALSLQAGSHAGILFPTVSNHLGTSLYYFLTPTCFCCSSTYLHRCISWLMARSRVNIYHCPSIRMALALNNPWRSICN